MNIIDAYTHCGISKYEPIEQVRAVMCAAGVDSAVLAQHLGEFDNSYIGSVVEGDPDHFAGIGLIDPDSDNAEQSLQQLAESNLFSGARWLMQVADTAPHLLDACADLGLGMIFYAPQGTVPFIDGLSRVLDKRLDARVMLSHLGNPTSVEPDYLQSHRRIFELSRYANVYLQLSAMGMFCPHPHEPLHDFVADAVEAFGTKRVVWGSNYPVCGTQDDYIKDLRLLLDGQLPIASDAIPDIAGANARRFWFDR